MGSKADFHEHSAEHLGNKVLQLLNLLMKRNSSINSYDEEHNTNLEMESEYFLQDDGYTEGQIFVFHGEVLVYLIVTD
jgi:hypothetical protein